jgi:hypothetical protein
MQLTIGSESKHTFAGHQRGSEPASRQGLHPYTLAIDPDFKLIDVVDQRHALSIETHASTNGSRLSLPTQSASLSIDDTQLTFRRPHGEQTLGPRQAQMIVNSS